MYATLVIINLIVSGFLFYKDPVLATALFIGGIVSLTLSGSISLIEYVIKTHRKENYK